MSRLFLSFLGTFQATLDQRPLIGFESSKVRALLVYLVIQKEPHTRDELAGLLWPDFPNQTARKNLRQALNNLRHILGDVYTSPPFLLVSHDTIQWNPESDFYLDLAEFRQLLAVCANHTHRHVIRCHSCSQRREQAAALYREDLLTHFFLADSQPFEEWLLLQRESLRRLIMPALYRLTAFYEETRQPEQAQYYATQQLELDPWREEAHRQMMRALAASGQRSAALVQYHTCCRLLEKELGVKPTKITQELYARIQAAEEDTVAYTQLPVHNLPRPSAPLVGRRQELAQLTGWLEQANCRLLTLTGPGGIGKTRLALQIAQEMAVTFPDGVAFIKLAPIVDGDFLSAAIAQGLSLSLSGQVAPTEQVSRYLADKEVLLLLDAFDRLVDDAMSHSFLQELLERAPALTLLVTSRERLGMSGERVLEVRGLPIIAEEMVITTNAETAVTDAVALFLQQARHTRPNFQLTAANTPAIKRICHLVGGLPLALELAAAWVKQLTCTEIAADIEQGLHLLSGQKPGGERGGIYAVFDGSWCRLSTHEQQALSTLSVFCGGFEQEAARQVAGASLALLAELVNKSLLYRQQDGRYTIHPLLRQYADEQLQAMGEKECVCRQHLCYFVELAETSELALRGSEQHIWMRRVELEQDNLQAALTWGTKYESENAARLASSLYLFWFMGGHLNEKRDYFEALDHNRCAWPNHLQARFLIGYATLCGGQGDMLAADSLTKEALSLFRESGNDEGMAIALQYLAIIAVSFEREPEKAMALFEEALSFARRVPNQWATRNILQNMIDVYVGLKEFERAELLAAQALIMCQEAEDTATASYILINLANSAQAQGNTEKSRQLLLQVLANAEKLQNRFLIATAFQYLGEISLAANETAQAK